MTGVQTCALPISSYYSFEGGAGSGGVEAVADSWKADQSTEEAEASARRTVDDPDVSKRGLNPVAAVGLALLAAVIGAGLVVGILRDEGSFTRIAPAEETTSASTNAENPLGAAPPQVTSLTGEYADGQVTWTWSVPDGLATADVTYSYEGSGPAGTTHGSVEAATVSVDGASGENCMEITTVSRSSGRMSDPVRACQTVP